MKNRSKINVVRIIGGLFFTLAFTACSNQWRDADLGLDGAEVLEILSEYDTTANSQSGSTQEQQFLSLKNNENSSIYYADASSQGGPLGPLVSVFSVVRYDFMGAELLGLSFFDLSEVRIAFIDLVADDGHQCSLLVDVKVASTGNSIKKFFSCSAVEVNQGEFLATLDGVDGVQIALRSFDVDQNGELKGVIQMRVSDFDSFGNEQDNGKFSTLVGFGP